MKVTLRLKRDARYRYQRSRAGFYAKVSCTPRARALPDSCEIVSLALEIGGDQRATSEMYMSVVIESSAAQKRE